MLDTLNNRTSIRKYTDKKVDKSDLEEVLNAACRASTTGNMQVYSIVATTSDDVKKELAGCHFNQPMVTEAPVVLTFCADFNRFNKWCKMRQAEPGYDNFLSFMTASIDALLVAQTACVAAEAKGMGICYLGTTTYLAQKIIDVLDLPKGVVPITTVTLGYAAEKPEQIDRLPLESVLHYDKYTDYTDDAIELFYSEKEAREDNMGFVAENNKQSLAQVFTDVRYKMADNKHFSKELLNVLESQGYMNND